MRVLVVRIYFPFRIGSLSAVDLLTAIKQVDGSFYRLSSDSRSHRNHRYLDTMIYLLLQTTALVLHSVLRDQLPKTDTEAVRSVMPYCGQRHMQSVIHQSCIGSLVLVNIPPSFKK